MLQFVDLKQETPVKRSTIKRKGDFKEIYNDYKIFDSSNCSGLTVEGLKKNFQNMVNVFKRREKLLSQYENLDPQQIIENTVQMIDPMFDHPYCWHGIGEENLIAAKKLWNINL